MLLRLKHRTRERGFFLVFVLRMELMISQLQDSTYSTALNPKDLGGGEKGA